MNTISLDLLSPPSKTGKSAPESKVIVPVRIILAESQPIYRAGIRKIFAMEDDLQVVAKAETLQKLHIAIQVFPTDVVLLEDRLLSGSQDPVPALLHAAPHVRLIVQVSEIDETRTLQLYHCGVRGVVPRSIAPDLLVKCVRKVAQGETWIDNRSINWVIEAYRAHAAPLISPRARPSLSNKEYVLISCVTQGMRNKEIAHHIGTTEQVIKNYLRKVYDKLGVSDRLELALYCFHNQLLKESPAVASTMVSTRTDQRNVWVHSTGATVG